MSFFLMYVIGMSLFRREAIKSSVCKPYKEMSIKARITRNNKWLLEMPSRDSRSCFANIIRKKNRVLGIENSLHRLESQTRIDGFSFCLQILHFLYKRNLTSNYTIIKSLIRDPKVKLQDY